MKDSLRKFQSFVLSTLILFFFTAQSTETENQKFAKLADDFLAGYFKANPITATWIGVHDYDGILDDTSPGAIKKEVERLESFKARLSTINASKLNKANNIDYRILQENIDELIFDYNELKEHEWNPMVYTNAVGSSMAYLLYQDFAPLEKRMTNLLERLNGLPVFLEQAKSNLKNAPKIHVETAIRQNKGNIGICKDEIPAYADKVSSELRDKIKATIPKAIASLEDFGKWLEQLLPKAAMSPRVGKDLYYKKVRYSIKSSLSPDEILTRAEAEKVKVQSEMYEIALPLYKEYYKKDPQGLEKREVIRSVLDKIVLDHAKKNELMDKIRSDIHRLTEFIKQKDLLALDESQLLVIRETPEYERGVAVASLEAPGPLEKNLKTFYNVTPIPEEWDSLKVESYLREYNNWSLQDLNIHEGIPGHYVQLYYSNRYPSIIRSVFGSGPMVEGWAVYAERMMVENGYMNGDPRMKLINLKWYIRAVINAIIDHKIHVGTMTEQEAIDLMTKDGFQELAEAQGKWRRANLTSAQLSSYFVGFQEIWDLRNDYKKMKGDRFNLKEFHETFLKYGSPSVKYLRELLLSGG